MINFENTTLAYPTIVISLSVLLFSGVTQATIQDVQHLDFRVFLEEKEIGYHRVQIRSNHEATDISVEASFDIKILFFNAFSYRHSAVEHWNGTCLQAVQSETDYGGDQLFLRSERAEAGLKIINQERQITLPGCVRSYAYWDLERLRSSKLLNTQTGEYQDAKITELGVRPLRVGNAKLLANCYQLETEEGTISLWYGEDRRWLGLQTRVKGERVLSYLSEAVNVES